MEKIIDINYIELFTGYSLMLIPIFVLWYYKTGLVKDTIIATVRMTIQLLLVGVYLEYIFKLNSVIVNIIWVILMLFVASYSITHRSKLSYKLFFIPVLMAGVISISLTDAFFLGYIIKLNNIFDARYFIPITGMLLGNTIKNVIITLDGYYKKIDDEQNLFRWYLANGATKREVLLPFIRDALRLAFNPVIATTSITGLISLPGMMTGQILGGSNPETAVKYQIMLMITIFSSGILIAFLTIVFSNKVAFDNFGNLKTNIFR